MNKAIESKNHCIIITSSGKQILIDDDDYSLLKQSTWCVNAQGYAVSMINKKMCRMHRIILNAGPGVMIDHINGG
jgi:hypothetical protein